MLTEVDHVFLQAILAREKITEEELASLINKLNQKLQSSKTLDEVVANVSQALLPIDMDFKRYKDVSFRGDAYAYVLIMNVPLDETLSKVAMNQSQALHLKQIIDEMLNNTRCTGVKYRKIEYANKKELFKAMITSNRFIEIKSRSSESENLEESSLNTSASYTITTAFALEIAEYIKKEHLNKTVFPCAGCKEWVLNGVLCGMCNFRVHRVCYEPFFESRDLPPGTCPECGRSIGL